MRNSTKKKLWSLSPEDKAEIIVYANKSVVPTDHKNRHLIRALIDNPKFKFSDKPLEP